MSETLATALRDWAYDCGFNDVEPGDLDDLNPADLAVRVHQIYDGGIGEFIVNEDPDLATAIEWEDWAEDHGFIIGDDRMTCFRHQSWERNCIRRHAREY